MSSRFHVTRRKIYVSIALKWWIQKVAQSLKKYYFLSYGNIKSYNLCSQFFVYVQRYQLYHLAQPLDIEDICFLMPKEKLQLG